MMLSQNLKESFKTLLFFTFIFLANLFVKASFFNEASFIPADEGNFCSQKNNFCDGYGMPRNFPKDVSLIVIHVGEGSFDSIVKWFQNPNARVSAHYVISREGKIVSMVNEENIAWHAGNFAFNQVSIGIEQEGYTKEKGSFTQEMYFALAKLLRHLIQKWKIKPIHPQGGVLEPIGIIGHDQVPNPKKEFCKNCDFGGCNCHFDPGPYFDWDYLMNLVTGGGRPDLVLENVKIEPENFASGDEIKVSLLIKNQGEGDTIGSFFLNAYLDQNLIFQKEIPPLNKFESYNFSFSFFWPKNPKEYEFSLKIEDPYEYILEKNKDNNLFSKKLFSKINRPPKISEVKILEEKKDKVSISILAQDEDNDEIKYILASPKGILFDTDFSLNFKRDFSIQALDFQKPIFLQIKDKRGESSEVQVLQNLAGREISLPQIEVQKEIQNQKGEIQKENEIYHFPIKIVFKLDPKYNLRYCLEKNCLPLLFDKNQITNEGFIEFSKSEDIILRYQVLDLAQNSATLVQENKIILRKADINEDGKVGIADFSILMAMWQKTNSEKNEAFLADLNADGIVNLPDFSILMAYFEEI
jgi:N-acetyl-anhydromuramyl-L-alanine amidase AmpD